MRCQANFARIRETYIFGEIRRRIGGRTCDRRGRPLLSLGVGDVSRPVAPAVAAALKAAADEMADPARFRGYGPGAGYAFLREAIAERYAARRVSLSPDEVFVTDGAKSALSDLAALFGDAPMYLPSPAYPATADACLLAGRAVRFLPADEERGCLPRPEDLPDEPGVVWLCSPANPQGVAYDRAGLSAWVAAARRRGDAIVFDAAYTPFCGGEVPASIYEIPQAERCAVEVGSFSKGASFTGLRCGWCVVPRRLVCEDGVPLGARYARRCDATNNGVSYPVQRAAQAALSEAGRAWEAESVAGYLRGARLLGRALNAAGYRFCGGEVSPYLWVRCRNGGGSWDLFADWLENKGLVVTPGVGFGDEGEGYVRLSALGGAALCEEAARRIAEGD